MEVTLSWDQEETILPEPSEYLLDMFDMLFWVLRVDEDVIEVDNHEHVKEVREDIIHEVLESSRCICEPKGHHTPFKGSVSGAECGLLFITLSDTDQVICVLEVEFRVDSGLSWDIKEIFS